MACQKEEKGWGRYVTAFPRFSIGRSSQNSLYGGVVSKFPHRIMRHHFVWWKHGDTAVANCAPKSLFYAQTNAIYRFYTYQLVIDDAPTIVDGQYWPLQNLTSTNLSTWAHRLEVPFLAKNNSLNRSDFFARTCAEQNGHPWLFVGLP